MAKKVAEEQAVLDDAGQEALERLSSQVEKAIGLIRELKRERLELRERVEELEEKLDGLEEKANRAGELERQQVAIDDERAEIRKRIESILEKFEELDGEE